VGQWNEYPVNGGNLVNRKIVLCGNGGLLRYAGEKLQEDSSVEVLRIIGDINQLSAEDLLEAVDSVVLAVSWRETEQWIAKIKACNAGRIYRVPVHAMQYRLPIIQNGHFLPEIVAKVSEKGTDLLYLETHVADICNLKCKGCMYFSNIATKANFPDLEDFERDFARLSELFANIFIIRLMGGEPLMNPGLKEYIRIVRHYFPASEIRIVSNALLVPRQGEELWKAMRDNYVGMDISPYPPTIQNIEEIKGILDREGIPYGNISDTLHRFRKSLTLTPTNDPAESVQICQSSHCHFLRKGKIAKCPLPLLIGDFNQAYQCDIRSEDYYDIYEEQSGSEIREKPEQYADMGRYCPDKETFSHGGTFIPWRRTDNDARREDWVV